MGDSGRRPARVVRGDLPPDTFNFSDQVYRPNDEAIMDGELLERVHALSSRRRYRTALDEIFKVLDEDPLNDGALRLAMLILQAGRTEQLRAEEPVTDSYLNDRRLDPIFAVCSKCKQMSWIPSAVSMMPFGERRVMNPVGMQCYNCGFVVCRKCLERQRLDLDLAVISPLCPNCGVEALGTSVYPTGRPHRQMTRHEEPVVQVIVFREGPVPPDEEYLHELLETISPDALEDDVSLAGVSVFPWPEDRGQLAAYIARQLVRLAQGNNLKASLDHIEQTDARDRRGNRVHIVKLLVAPKLAASVKGLIETHTDRMIESNMGSPALPATEPKWRLLLRPDILKKIQIDVAEGWREALRDNAQHWYARQFDELTLFVSVVPALHIAEVRGFFGSGYLDFLNSKLLSSVGHQLGRVNIAHLIYCNDGEHDALHLTFLPESPEETVSIMAIDLLTPQERQMLGMPAGPGARQPQAAPGGLFWFDRTKISAAGHLRYGRYVYEQILSVLSGMLGRFPMGMHFFFDGDFLPTGPVRIPVYGEKESELLGAIIRGGPETPYVVGIWGEHKVLERLHRELVAANLVGYLGKTSCPGISFDDFHALTGELSLVFAALLEGNSFQKSSFGYLSDEQLRGMGLAPVDFGQ